jgi:hypothetical protein
LRAFLGRAYSLKALVDYETGAGSKVSHFQAVEAIEAGRSFVAAARVREIMAKHSTWTGCAAELLHVAPAIHAGLASRPADPAIPHGARR